MSARERQAERELEAAKPLVNLNPYKQKSIKELIECCEELGVKGNFRQKRQDILFQVAKALVQQGNRLEVEGVLEIQPGNQAFLRSVHNSFHAGADGVFVPANLVRNFQLRMGDVISGVLRSPKEKERFFSLVEVKSINGEEPSRGGKKVLFENLTPLFPQERLKLETGQKNTMDVAGRIIDLVAPVGKGQRGLIVSPPKAGKTIILQNIAHAIERNNPESHLIVLLIDERPEEVTEMQRSVRGQVIASTFDESAHRHVQVAEMVNGQAKRLVEAGKDVIILLDSITRLARAYNTVQPASGRILTGGVDAYALERPKRFFGSARNVEEGGSLTILATALIETGSKMDEVIYEEFKGTGNLELHLERRIAEKRVFPAISVRRSGTRKEELLLTEDELQHIRLLRQVLHSMDDIAATEFLLERLKETKNNEEFFEAMRRS
ncbi:MAG: transcription termination factor Rho [Gammaproteobacteria bacterium]